MEELKLSLRKTENESERLRAEMEDLISEKDSLREERVLLEEKPQ